MTDRAPVRTTAAGPLAMTGGQPAVPAGLHVLAWPVVTDQDREAVQQVLASGRFTAMSAGEPEIPALEREWAAQAGTRFCVAVANGTSALALALAALGIEPGDEVVVPALSFVATALAPVHALAVPVFADIDPDTFNLDPAAVRAAITPRTRAIVAVHLHGLPADMAALTGIAAQHGLALVEDAAQAHGAVCEGRPVGSIGLAGSFSLNVSKNLPTCGEGGLISTDDQDIAGRVTMLRQFGEVITPGTQRSYVSHLAGWNAKPNAIQAAFARSQLERFADDTKQRDHNVRAFLGRLSALPGLRAPGAPPGSTHAWHILRFRVDPAAFGLAAGLAGPLRAALMRALRAEGVPVSHYQLVPLPGQPVFQRLGGNPWRLPGLPARGYRTEDYVHALRVIDDSFTLQKAHLNPAAGPLLDAYASAFEKVWQHGDLIARYASGLDYQPPWQAARQLADRESAAMTVTAPRRGASRKG